MDTRSRSSGRIWTLWLQMVVAGVGANVTLRTVALMMLDIPAEFPPLAMPVPTIFFTVMGVSAGLGVSLWVGRSSAQPERRFRWIVIVALLLSFLPDVWLLSDAARIPFPGATIPAVVTLMAQHVLAGVIVVWLVTRRWRRLA